MSKDFWLDCWDKGEIRFHQKNINPQLTSFWPNIAKDKKPVFVPLCGKTLDMTYFAKRGHKVIGVEFSEKAILEFFSSLQLTPSVQSKGSFNIYEAENYQIYCGDLFHLDINLQEIAYVYDRASYIALNEETRKKYREWLIKHLSHAHILLLSIEFDNLEAGPPFSISQEELKEGFSSAYKIETLIDEEIDKSKVPHSQIINQLIERVHKLSPK